MHAEAIAAVLPGETRAVLPEALELYLRFHRFPELSGQERQTAAGFAAVLKDAGYRVTACVGGHGVVGVLANGDGPIVMLRTELDALPVAERTGLPYASTIAPAPESADDGGAVMHACGHDAHAACAAGAARVLARLSAQWSGTAIVIGQPAEETLQGARAMLLDGLYRRFPRPDVVLAQHVAPFPAGFAAHGDSIMLAASVTLDVTVTGSGGHPATSRAAANPIEVAVAAVTELRRSAAASGDDDAVVSIGALHAGTSANVIPGEARGSVTLRCRDEARLEQLARALEAILRDHQLAGETDAFRISERSRSPATVNDPAYGSAVRAVHESVLGGGRVMTWPGSMATEDFCLLGPAGTGLYGAPAVPAVYWAIGCVGPRRWRDTVPGGSAADKMAALPPNHSGRFAIDPVPTLSAGITTMASAALGLLGPGPR